MDEYHGLSFYSVPCLSPASSACQCCPSSPGWRCGRRSSYSESSFFVVIASSCSLTLLWWLTCAWGCIPAFWHGSSTFLVAGALFPAFWNFSGLGGVFPAFWRSLVLFLPLDIGFPAFGRYYLCQEYGGGDFQPFYSAGRYWLILWLCKAWS